MYNIKCNNDTFSKQKNYTINETQGLPDFKKEIYKNKTKPSHKKKIPSKKTRKYGFN